MLITWIIKTSDQLNKQKWKCSLCSRNITFLQVLKLIYLHIATQTKCHEKNETDCTPASFMEVVGLIFNAQSD